jgi:hypothetical protein
MERRVIGTTLMTSHKLAAEGYVTFKVNDFEAVLTQKYFL